MFQNSGQTEVLMGHFSSIAVSRIVRINGLLPNGRYDVECFRWVQGHIQK